MVSMSCRSLVLGDELAVNDASDADGTYGRVYDAHTAL